MDTALHVLACCWRLPAALRGGKDADLSIAEGVQALLAPQAGDVVQLLQQQLRALQERAVPTLQAAQHSLHGLAARRAASLGARDQSWKDDDGGRGASNLFKHGSCKLSRKRLRGSIERCARPGSILSIGAWPGAKAPSGQWHLLWKQSSCTLCTAAGLPGGAFWSLPVPGRAVRIAVA